MRLSGGDAARALALAWCVALPSVVPLSSAPAAQAAAATGLTEGSLFTETTPLSSNAEIARRMLSPLAVAALQRMLARAGETMRPQSVDPVRERFTLYVPPVAPPQGYGLLVFVPPWPDDRLPQGWAGILDRYGFIFVSAARSGNDDSVLDRRVPLALIAEQDLARRFAVDPARIYVGGFSGGARVAMRIALAYPDIFRGAVLDAGADPIGKNAILPPGELFSRFQESTRLVYLTGSQDIEHLGMAAVSERSMQDWCVFDNVALTMPDAGHVVASPAALSEALDALARPRAPEPDKLAACRSGIEADLSAMLRQAQTLTEAGRRDDAESLVTDIDRRFGGLAAPRSVELQSELWQAEPGHN